MNHAQKYTVSVLQTRINYFEKLLDLEKDLGMRASYGELYALYIKTLKEYCQTLEAVRRLELEEAGNPQGLSEVYWLERVRG